MLSSKRFILISCCHYSFKLIFAIFSFSSAHRTLFSFSMSSLRSCRSNSYFWWCDDDTSFPEKRFLSFSHFSIIVNVVFFSTWLHFSSFVIWFVPAHPFMLSSRLILLYYVSETKKEKKIHVISLFIIDLRALKKKERNERSNARE